VRAPKPNPGLLGALIGLPEHRLLDRMIRGRVWIGFVAFALIGIVTMQLLVLKLNTGIGHALVQQSRLQRENAAMSIENSTAAAGENIEPEANRKGMQVAPVGAIGFVTVTKADIAHAAAALRNAAPISARGSETQTASNSSEPSATSTESTESTSTQTAAAETPPPSTAETSSAGESSASSQAPTAESESASATPSQTTSSAAVAPSGESSPVQPASASGGTAPPSQG
jgi:hypothetical protein